MSRVSVVVPCFNQGHYLGQALESILAQTLSEWDAIVVDDGSTDDTATVARSYRDPRIRYSYQDNRGLSGARNAGINSTGGRYLTFLDADDEWEPDFLGSCLASLDESGDAPGVYTLNSYIDADGEVIGQSNRLAEGQTAFRQQLLRGGIFPPCAAVIRREVLRATGLFDEGLAGRGLEDWDLWLRLSEHGYMIAIPQAFARYRVYPGSMSMDADIMETNRLAVLNKHFGPPSGDPEEWVEEKRYAYGFGYLAAAQSFMEQRRRDECRAALDKSVRAWPGILTNLGTYYGLAIGDRMNGYRGRPMAHDVRENGQWIVSWLDDFFANEWTGAVAESRRRAYGQAYLALAMVSEQSGDWAGARGYIRRAMAADPGLATKSPVVRRTIKLHLGQRVANEIKGMKSA